MNGRDAAPGEEQASEGRDPPEDGEPRDAPPGESSRSGGGARAAADDTASAGDDPVPAGEFEPVPAADDSAPAGGGSGPGAADRTDPAGVDDLVPEDGAVVLFDGVCNLCSGFVGFLIPRDPEGRLRYASLQSAVADDLTADCDHEANLDSIVLVEADGCYEKSDAVLRIAGHLGGWYSPLRAFRVVPRPVRDLVYDLVARYRYQFFGQKDRCMIPTEDVRSRFVGDPTAVPGGDDRE